MGEKTFLARFRSRGSLPAMGLVGTLLLLLLCGATARAEILPGRASVSPYVGGFVFEGNQDLKHRPVFGVRLGYDFTKNWGAEALFDDVPTRYGATDSSTNVFNYRLEGLYHLWPDRKLVPFLAVGAGGMSIHSRDDAVDKNRAVLDYGAGLKYALTDRIALRADLRHLLAFGSTYNNLEYSLGVVFYFGGVKTAAARAVPETREAREIVPAPARDVPPPQGAEPIKLAAQPVSESRTALAWGPASGAAGYRISRDGSEIRTTRMLSEFDSGLKPETRYCYVVTALDPSGREFTRSNEACATTFPAPAPQPAAPAAAPERRPQALEDIHFDFDKANLKPLAQAILKRHAAWMMENRDVILRIVVEGHCDERGTAEYNMALGQRRADAAARYLIDLGIDGQRITTVSYGFERPVDPGHNEAAWAKNRRAHFVVTGQAGAGK